MSASGARRSGPGGGRRLPWRFGFVRRCGCGRGAWVSGWRVALLAVVGGGVLRRRRLRSAAVAFRRAFVLRFRLSSLSGGPTPLRWAGVSLVPVFRPSSRPASFGVVEPEIPPLPSFPRSPGEKGDGSLGGPLASAKGAGSPPIGARARPLAGDRAGRGV